MGSSFTPVWLMLQKIKDVALGSKYCTVSGAGHETNGRKREKFQLGCLDSAGFWLHGRLVCVMLPLNAVQVDLFRPKATKQAAAVTTRTLRAPRARVWTKHEKSFFFFLRFLRLFLLMAWKSAQTTALDVGRSSRG